MKNEDRGCSLASLTGQVFNARAIPTPGWRKIESASKDSAATTATGDGKMGRSWFPRGRYAIGAARNDMSHHFVSQPDIEETKTDSVSVDKMVLVCKLRFVCEC